MCLKVNKHDPYPNYKHVIKLIKHHQILNFLRIAHYKTLTTTLKLLFYILQLIIYYDLYNIHLDYHLNECYLKIIITTSQFHFIYVLKSEFLFLHTFKFKIIFNLNLYNSILFIYCCSLNIYY
jgi:hypothetical protein